jgi:hypothetical protein
MSETVLWLHPAIACVHADIMLHRVMRPVAASPGAISDTYAEGNGDYPPLCRYNVAPGNAIGGSIFGVRCRGGLGSFTSLFGDTYVGGMMLLWRHRAGVCVPADPASVGQCQLWPRHRAGDHEGRGTCANLFRAEIFVPASCGDYWPLYRCITSSGNNIGSEQLRHKGSRRILCPSPSTLSARVRFFVHRVRERLRASLSLTALLQQQASVVILRCANACLRARCFAIAPADCSDYPPLRRCSALWQW